MADAAICDTLEVARALRKFGFKADQAEARAAAKRHAPETGLGELATTASVAKLEADHKWIKLIGGAIVTALIQWWLAELISDTMPGQ